MLIDIHELETQSLVFDQAFSPESMDFGAEIEQLEPLKVKGRADLVEEHQSGKGGKGTIQDIRLVGELSTRVHLPCARCLEPVPFVVERDFDLLYRPEGIDSGHEELSVTDAEAEIGYYAGDGMLLEDVLREQVLLSLPMKMVCRDDCRGLCPQCGKNLNQGSCSCARPTDPRWQALETLKDKLHE